MRPNRLMSLIITASLALGVTATGCKSVHANEDGKIPITTKSDEARSEFLLGRDLSERLLGQESLQHFDKAIALDPDFAIAELNRANNSATAKEFLDHLNKAVSLTEKVTEGERLLILANEAAANGNTVKQKDYLEKLVALYPNDERAQFNLANYYFFQQELDPAIEHEKKTTELAPSFSGAYNILGYAYSQKGDYAEAEQAFKKYVELIPQDPNPYDSYAELLLKMGRFADSVVQYRKALSVDPNFNPSRFGLSADLTYMGKPEEAAAELKTMADRARNDGELRTAYFAMAVLAADQGKLDEAVQAIDKQYAIAQKKNDMTAMAGDLRVKGNILMQMSKFDLAKQQFDHSLQLMEASNVSQEAKDNARLMHWFDLTGVAIGKKDYTSAKIHSEQFRQGAEASKNSLQIMQLHELAGRIALAEKNYDNAIAELEQSNLQNPYNLYRLAQAYQAKGYNAKAKLFYTQAAEFNSLPALNYAYIRIKAQKLAAEVKG